MSRQTVAKASLSPAQEQRRQTHIIARRSIAEGLLANQNQLASFAVGFIYQGFWARFRWLLFGPSKPSQTKGN